MNISSPVFSPHSPIPSTYTCDGDNVNPPLIFENIPTHTKSLVLIMEDPDIPQEIKNIRNIDVFDHWVIFNIPPHTTSIDEAEPIGTLGKNSNEQLSYTGPCPPPQYKPTTHRYFFKLYALDTIFDLHAGISKDELLHAMDTHIIDTTELIGTYDRSN